MFSFGGAYGSIPLIRQVVLSNGWMPEEVFNYFVAVCESTPGPIMVNMATYVGSSQAGFWGAVLATIGVVLPSFIIILVIVSLMKDFIKSKHVQAILRGITPCFIGIVFAMGIYMTINNVLPDAAPIELDLQALLITGLLFALSFGYQKIKREDFPPILFIVISAVAGSLVYAL